MAINSKYGYVRVSSKSQESNSSIEFQKQQLIQNGIQAKKIFESKLDPGPMKLKTDLSFRS